jgi:hypothetical protein
MRYLRAFFLALWMTIRGEKPERLHERLWVWVEKTPPLVEAVVEAADENGLDKDERRAIMLNVDGREQSVQTVLDAIHYHTKEEYPYLLQNPVDSHITAIYASNMNDQYAVQVMYSTKALQDTEVNQKVEALANHLNAIPPSTELTNTAKS